MTLAGGLVLALLAVLWTAACLNGIGHGIAPAARTAGGDHDDPPQRRLVELGRHLMLRCRRGLSRLPTARPPAAPASPEHPETK